MAFSGFYLLSARINGIKCINREIELSFYKKTVNNDFNPDKYRIKGIYGENGSGKTAIINAFSILRSLLVFPNYIQSHNQYLSMIMNKDSNELSLECDFYTNTRSGQRVNRYSVVISRSEMDYRIVEESLYERKPSSPYTVFTPVFKVFNGEIIYIKDENKTLKLKDTTKNLLSYSTLSSLIMNNKSLSEFEFLVVYLYIFSLCIVVSIPQEDKHELFAFKNTIRDHIEKYRMGEFEDSVLSIIEDLPDGAARISKSNVKAYYDRVNKMEGFIKLFKPSLKSIDIEKKPDGDSFRCYLHFNYGDYLIDYEFESAGIKKLASIFDALYSAAIGMIVFIDEIDANVNSIYLEALIQYMMYYGKGQLCFTSHNIDIMDTLKSNKKAIDFLTSDVIIVPWTNNGNKLPSTTYKNGVVEGMPYNIFSTDFIKVFGG